VLTKDMPVFKNKDKYSIGDWTYGYIDILGEHLLDKLTVGKYCSIGGNVQMLIDGHEHRPDWITTYPLRTMLGLEPSMEPKARREVVIGNDVWIGEGVLIFSGSVIESGAIIGARAVVKGHVLPYSIMAGNPAKLIRWRHSQEERDFLLSIRWWDWPDETVRAAAPLLLSKDFDALREFAYAETGPLHGGNR
jgi:acetyltransferase-like isoleucine patch superfamily enzyme